MEFNYESVNDALYNRHKNLSSSWSTLTWDDDKATVGFMLEDGTEEDATVDRSGNVTASEKLISEMEDIG
tara:strand:- start:1080 stop:1289 length:210 start_codon:yes stop_codon:yes gene_type:complete